MIPKTPTMTMTKEQQHLYSHGINRQRKCSSRFDHCYYEDDDGKDDDYDDTRNCYKNDCFLIMKPLLKVFGVTNNDERRRKKNGFDYIDTWGEQHHPRCKCHIKQQHKRRGGLFRDDWESTSTITTFCDDREDAKVQGGKHYYHTERKTSERGLLRQVSSKTLTTVTRTITTSSTSITLPIVPPIKSALKELEVWDILDVAGVGSFDDVTAAKAWTQLHQSHKIRK